MLIHYPNQKTTFGSEETRVVTSTSWDALVAPRYSNLENFELLTGNLSDQPGHYATGTVTENTTGKKVFVVLFQRRRGPWMEFICPDRNSFVQAFGIDKVDYYFTAWELLEKMSYYNRFAVSAADLPGIWKANFSGMQQYVNVYTGTDAGMNTYSSSEVLDFRTTSSYAWSLGVASGFVGNIKYAGAKSSGSYTLPNPRQINFSDIEGKPRSSNVIFSCIKGARILWIGETPYGRE
jgi:hypothetical protein